MGKERVREEGKVRGGGRREGKSGEEGEDEDRRKRSFNSDQI